MLAPKEGILETGNYGITLEAKQLWFVSPRNKKPALLPGS